MSIVNNKVESFVGQVVSVSGQEERIMSDVWEWVVHAIVLKADGTYEDVSGCSYYGFSATVDATPEQVQAYKIKAEAERVEAERVAREYAAQIEANTVRIGKKVVVARGRKVPVGTVGILFWVKETQYGKKVGIALDSEKDNRGFFKNVAWTYWANLEVA